MTDPAGRPVFTVGACVVIATLVLGAWQGRPAPDEAAVSLLRESLDRHQSGSMEYAGELTTISRNGSKRLKTWRSYRQGPAGSADRLIVFLAPAEVRGVAFLSRGLDKGVADQWLYLPSMGRERRLAEPDRDIRFAGTDFTFEDLNELDPDQYRISALPDGVINGEPVARTRLVPLGRSAYDEEVITLRKKDLVMLTRESRRRGESVASKRLTLGAFTQIDGHVVAQQLEMTDAVRGSRTVIRLSEIQIGRPQPADRFAIQNLPRAVR